MYSKSNSLTHDQQEKIFKKLSLLPENKECADCSRKNPSWATIDFGALVCLECSGLHRELGPTVTRVKSINLDTWTKDLIEIMISHGNKISVNYWEYNIPKYYQRPNQDSSKDDFKRFIRDKYLKKMFVPNNEIDPVSKFLAMKKRKQTPEFNLEEYLNDTIEIPVAKLSPPKKQNDLPSKQIVINNAKKESKAPDFTDWEKLPFGFESNQPKNLNRASKVLNDWANICPKKENDSIDINTFKTVGFDIRGGNQKNTLEYLKEVNNLNGKKIQITNNVINNNQNKKEGLNMNIPIITEKQQKKEVNLLDLSPNSGLDRKNNLAGQYQNINQNPSPFLNKSNNAAHRGSSLDNRFKINENNNIHLNNDMGSKQKIGSIQEIKINNVDYNMAGFYTNQNRNFNINNNAGLKSDQGFYPNINQNQNPQFNNNYNSNNMNNMNNINNANPNPIISLYNQQQFNQNNLNNQFLQNNMQNFNNQYSNYHYQNNLNYNSNKIPQNNYNVAPYSQNNNQIQPNVNINVNINIGVPAQNLNSDKILNMYNTKNDVNQKNLNNMNEFYTNHLYKKADYK